MTTLVDLRHWRIEADPVCLDQTADPDIQPSHRGLARPDGAEIILFPRISRALLQRPRKALKRRFASHIADQRV